MFVLDFSGAALHEYIWPSVYSLHHKLSTLVSCLKLMLFVPSMFCGLRSKTCMLALSLSWDKYHCHKWHHKGLISEAPPLKHTFWKDAPAKEIQGGLTTWNQEIFGRTETHKVTKHWWGELNTTWDFKNSLKLCRPTMGRNLQLWGEVTSRQGHPPVSVTRGLWF